LDPGQTGPYTTSLSPVPILTIRHDPTSDTIQRDTAFASA
jgi:hypothetical protein